MALPQLTDEQRAAALEKAAAARRIRAELKDRLKRGGTNLKQVLVENADGVQYCDAIGRQVKFSTLSASLPIPRFTETLSVVRLANMDMPALQITQAFGVPGRAGRARIGFSLYEHAFLLPDGAEVSLWEVEHTDTPDGRHMCEVYDSEDTARLAMERRAAQVS